MKILRHQEMCYIPVLKCVMRQINNAGSHPEVFLGKGALKICSKFTGEHPRRSPVATLWHHNYYNYIHR